MKITGHAWAIFFCIASVGGASAETRAADSADSVVQESETESKTDFSFGAAFAGGYSGFYPEKNSSSGETGIKADRYLAFAFPFSLRKGRRDGPGILLAGGISIDAGSHSGIYGIAVPGKKETERMLPGFYPADEFMLRWSFPDQYSSFMAGKISRKAESLPDHLYELENQETFYSMHGSSAGAGFMLSHPSAGRIYILPYAEPAFYGSFERKNSSGAVHADSLHYASVQFSRSREEVSRSAFRRGHEILYAGRFENFLASAGILSFENAAENGEKKTALHAEYIHASVGGEFRKKDFYSYFYISAENASGTAREVQTEENPYGKERMSGSALFSSLFIQYRKFSIHSRLYIPEPPTDYKKNEIPVRKSGYIGYGERHIQTPILRNALSVSPHPVFCGGRAVCSGILGSKEETFYFAHASAAGISLLYESSVFSIEANLQGVFPLRERSENGKNAFQRLRRKNENEWIEGEIAVRFSKNGMKGYLSCSRLHRRENKKTSYAGQSFHASLEAVL